ncbi:hypothetical protein CBER1_11890 [Cercospora berteroae]|uniref:Fungal calcium binding protein domain-containing protein n=1 Tax=Cercospora berteroae TaxID=357750 RepID=A0A2S6C0N0_9PEZI|nr:hypothetical protein CBER1_11890 [Cercospora berteroae]
MHFMIFFLNILAIARAAAILDNNEVRRIERAQDDLEKFDFETAMARLILTRDLSEIEEAEFHLPHIHIPDPLDYIPWAQFARVVKIDQTACPIPQFKRCCETLAGVGATCAAAAIREGKDWQENSKCAGGIVAAVSGGSNVCKPCKPRF